MRVNRRIRAGGGVPDPIGPVLFGIIDDEVRNAARARRRRRSDAAPDSAVPTSKPGPEQLFENAERRAGIRRDVEAIFSRMRTEERELLTLAHMDDVSLKEIAEGLGISEATLRVRLHRARVKFAELYRHHHGSRRRS
jgi:RNA polymerase sigma-70 factor (ECF subfamily)